MKFLCSLLLVAGFQFCNVEPPPIPGYVEGDYVTVAPMASASIRQIHVAKGESVRAGQLLVELDSEDTELQLAQARFRLLEARAALANLGKGRRPEEIDVLSAAVASLEAEERRAQQEANRAIALFEKNVNSRAQIEAVQTALDIARAKLAEGRATLAVATLPARADDVLAQQQRVADAEAAHQLAMRAHNQRRLTAPADGYVEDVIRRPGELAGPAAPVLSLLPKHGVRIRFFIAEPERVRIRPGAAVGLSCSNCPEGMRARVERVSTKPEFTPPVLYSIDRRQKLSYLAEAIGEDQAALLQPGQLVSISVLSR